MEIYNFHLKDFMIFFILLNARKAFGFDGKIETEIISLNEDHNLCADSAYSNICVKLGEKYYLIDKNAKLNWYNAERLCRRQNGFLATIENAHEMTLISDFLLLNKYIKWFWIGGNDLGSEGAFHSTDTGNLMPFSNWSPGEPNNVANKENCVNIWEAGGSFSMNDLDCEHKTGYICELKEQRSLNMDSRWHRSV